MFAKHYSQRKREWARVLLSKTVDDEPNAVLSAFLRVAEGILQRGLVIETRMATACGRPSGTSFRGQRVRLS